MQDISLDELKQVDQATLAEKVHRILSGDNPIGTLFREIQTEMVHQAQPPASDTVGAPGFLTVDPYKAMFRAMCRYIDGIRDKVYPICDRIKYCESIRNLKKWSEEVAIIKSLAEFLSTLSLGIPVVAVSWYIVKNKIMDIYVCQCDSKDRKSSKA